METGPTESGFEMFMQENTKIEDSLLNVFDGMQYSSCIASTAKVLGVLLGNMTLDTDEFKRVVESAMALVINTASGLRKRPEEVKQPTSEA